LNCPGRKTLRRFESASEASGTPRGADAIGLAVGKVIGRRKVAKHFDLSITDDSLTFERNHPETAAPPCAPVLSEGRHASDLTKCPSPQCARLPVTRTTASLPSESLRSFVMLDRYEKRDVARSGTDGTPQAVPVPFC
jgi:hypothetical protein